MDNVSHVALGKLETVGLEEFELDDDKESDSCSVSDRETMADTVSVALSVNTFVSLVEREAEAS